MKEKGIIFLKRCDRERLIASMGCSKALVSRSLRFYGNSKLAYMIRSNAMNLYGGLLFNINN